MSDDLKAAVARMNQSWLAGRFDELKDFFHPDVVLVHPKFSQRTVGRDSLVASYVDFSKQATIESFEADEAQADVTGDIAVTVCPWRMKYTFENSSFDESGWDLLVWNRRDGRWVVVWRTVRLKQ